MRIALILALTLFAACTPMPALEGRIGAEARAAPFPALVPIETAAGAGRKQRRRPGDARFQPAGFPPASPRWPVAPARCASRS